MKKSVIIILILAMLILTGCSDPAINKTESSLNPGKSGNATGEPSGTTETVQTTEGVENNYVLVRDTEDFTLYKCDEGYYCMDLKNYKKVIFPGCILSDQLPSICFDSPSEMKYAFFEGKLNEEQLKILNADFSRDKNGKIVLPEIDNLYEPVFEQNVKLVFDSFYFSYISDYHYVYKIKESSAGGLPDIDLVFKPSERICSKIEYEKSLVNVTLNSQNAKIENIRTFSDSQGRSWTEFIYSYPDRPKNGVRFFEYSDENCKSFVTVYYLNSKETAGKDVFENSTLVKFSLNKVSKNAGYYTEVNITEKPECYMELMDLLLSFDLRKVD